MENIARVNKAGKIQLLEDHLENTAKFCSGFLASSGFISTGRLLGLLHDLGKYSEQFQHYIRSIFGLLKEGDPGFIPNAEKMRGKIPHAETGIWYLDACFREIHHGAMWQDMRTLLGMPILYHHAFPEDVYAPDGETPFLSKKPSKGRGLDSTELFDRIVPRIREEIKDILTSDSDQNAIMEISRFCKTGRPPGNFDFGLLLRLFYSALIDADRTDAAEREPVVFQDWKILTKCLEENLAELSADTELNRLRKDISDVLYNAAGRARGIYRLTIPTGGGKTLAGLRFALHHAAKHGMKRVIYAAPFLSILEQNAEVFRNFLNDSGGNYVQECHSNVLSEQKSGEIPYGKLSETWDAPIICTSMVQILNAMFSGESRYARRFHLFSDAVILLDEIQSLPLEMFHIFNRTVNFLAERMHATVILCSATQPEFAEMDAEKGSIRFTESPELYPDYQNLFRKLKRVNTQYVKGIQNNDDIAAFAGKIIKQTESLLLICNTKPHAAEMFRLLREQYPEDVNIFHLSTNLCAAHRKDILKKIQEKLHEPGKVIVVSTSLIEAGVDISFGAVIRMMTSLDSIVQAAGRCNRNAESDAGQVYILDNPQQLKLPSFVSKWSVSTGKALRDYEDDPPKFNSDILSPDLLKIYYADLYSSEESKTLMQYPVTLEECKGETLLNLLGANIHSFHASCRLSDSSPKAKLPRLSGAFRTAGEKFKALDELADIAVIVPYGETGRQIIADFLSSPSVEEINILLRKAQLFTVNITKFAEEKLCGNGAIILIEKDDLSIWVAKETNYDCEYLGLKADAGHLETNIL